MKKLWDKLKDRPLIRAGIAYLMVGWLLMQVGEVMAPALNLPEWFLSAIAFVLIMGFPVVILGIWALEQSTKASAAEDIDHRPLAGSNRILDIGLFAAMALVLVAIGVNRIIPFFAGDNTEAASITAETARQSDSAAAQPAAASNAENPAPAAEEAVKSIAVLPFVDMSMERDQSYFSDGIAEEILNTLSHIKGLRVVHRSSSFSFKGKNMDMREIGTTLNAAYLLEGSVRKQGAQVRVTAQLIDGKDGFHLWSETYDRSLEDIFSVQEEIAESIAEELEVLLDVKSLVSADADTDPAAYETYLQGRHLFRTPGRGNLSKAIALFEEATDIDPDFALAWSALAQAHLMSPLSEREDVANATNDAELAALRAISQNPDLAEPYAVLGAVHVNRRNYSAMSEMFEKALERDPHNVPALNFHGYGLMAVGHVDRAVDHFQRTTISDPVTPQNHFLHATALLVSGDLEKAEAAANETLRLGMMHGAMPLADIARLRGDTAKAEAMASPLITGVARQLSKEDAALISRGVFGDGSEKEAALAAIKEVIAGKDNVSEIFIPNFLIMLDEPALAFEVFQNNTFAHDQAFYVALWGPYGAKARQHPAFPAFAEQAGLMDYWQEHGWPDKCKPATISGTEVKLICDQA